MINTIGAFFTHIPEPVSLLALGAVMTAAAAGLRNLLKHSREVEMEDHGESVREEHRTEG